MRAGGGKAKGSAFERYAAVRLSLWLTRGQRADLFSRNVLSGGRFTREARKGGELAIPGDLAAAHPLAIDFIKAVCVECKHHKDMKLDVYLFDGKARSSLAKVIVQAAEQARLVNAIPMVIIKQNNREAAVLLHYDVGIAALRAVRHKAAFVYHALHNETIFMTPLECFASLVDPKKFMDALRIEETHEHA